MTKSIQAFYPDVKIKPITLEELFSLKFCNNGIVIHLPYLGRGMFPNLRSLIRLKLFCNKSKFVVTLHGLDSFALRQECFKLGVPCPKEYCNVRQILRDLQNKALWHFLGNLIDAIIVPSNSTRKLALHHLGITKSHIAVIYHGVDHKIFKPYPSDSCEKFLRRYFNLSDPFILHVGSYQPKKTLRGLLLHTRYLKGDSILKRNYVLLAINLEINC